MKVFFKNICIISSTMAEELRGPMKLFFFFLRFIFLFLAVLGLPCCVWAFSSCYSPVAVHGLLIAMASLVAEHGLQGAQASVIVAHGFSSCSTACGIFLDWGSSLCPRLSRRILNHWTTRKAPCSGILTRDYTSKFHILLKDQSVMSISAI